MGTVVQWSFCLTHTRMYISNVRVYIYTQACVCEAEGPLYPLYPCLDASPFLFVSFFEGETVRKLCSSFLFDNFSDADDKLPHSA